MKRKASLSKYLIVSFTLHIAFMLGFYFIGLIKPKHAERESVNIDILTADEYQKLMAATDDLKEPVKNAPKKPAQVQTQQIVEQSETSANEEEVDTRFLSAKNQKVEKQTMAKDRGEFQNLKKLDSKESGTKNEQKAQKTETAAAKPSDEELAKNLFRRFDAQESLERQKLAEKNTGAGTGNLGDGTGGDTSRSNDYIKDVDQGLETMLNTREFKYYSYYSRIRRQLAQHWEGRVREKLSKIFNEGRAPAATNQDRITKLMIVLNEAGTLVKVQVLRDSGITDLDDAAIEAFRAAAPFPNPPKGIVEGDGTVKIRWDFVIET